MPETVEHILGAPKIPKRHYRHGWSPGYMLLKTHLSTLVTIRRHLLGTHRCSPWPPSERKRGVRKLIDRWQAKADSIKWPDGNTKHQFLNILPDYTPTHWRLLPINTLNIKTLAESIDSQITAVKSLLHARQRSDMRLQISHHVAVREKARRQRQYGKVIQSILGTYKTRFNFDSLSLPDDTVEADPIAVHNRICSHFQSWFEGPTEYRTGINYPASSLWTTLLHDREAFISHGHSLHIPLPLIEKLWKGLQRPLLHPNYLALKTELSTALAQPPTFNQFFNSIRRHSGLSSPGITNVTYNMLRYAPDLYLRRIYDLLSALWTLRITPASMMALAPTYPTLQTIHQQQLPLQQSSPHYSL
jgi:hypothetical protein